MEELANQIKALVVRYMRCRLLMSGLAIQVLEGVLASDDEALVESDNAGLT